jgi:photosynthetic reaction center cytochrome c subunit
MKSDQQKIVYCFNSLAVLTLLAFLVTGCERPPIKTEQRGYRGVGLVQNYNPRIVEDLVAVNQAPVSTPQLPSAGPVAGDTFQNVRVLGDLSVGQFTRLMTAMTAWVSPEQGCNYCHNPQDLASDEVYTKVVARDMIRMTRAANQDWQVHVGGTGVTCYTCHRGKPVPENVWVRGTGPKQARRMVPTMQNTAAESVAYASLPFDPFTPFLEQPHEIRVVSREALPGGGNDQNIKQAERTYGLMMHISDSLGVNCTYCHNSRSFLSWEQSPLEREKAWNAIRQVREINDVVRGLAGVLPENRKGPLGDPYKVNCNTCHQGVNRPLYGANMLKDYPSLAGEPD